MALYHKVNQKPGSRPLIGLLFSIADSNNPYSKQLFLIYIGFGSILSQILLLREFLVSFYGNELSIGIIFACWLLWIGAGSAAGNFVLKHKNINDRMIHVLLAITPVVTAAQILAVKFVRAVLHATVGEFLSMLDLLGFSFIVLSTGCLLWGLLFTLGAKSLSSEKEEHWRGVNKAYMLESLGSVAGGLLFSFALVTWFSTLQVVCLLALVAWNVVWWNGSAARKWRILAVPCSFMMFLVLCRPISSLEHKINATQWSFINDQLKFIGTIDTKYQNLSLLSLENQYTVYADGRPLYTIPNVYEAERFVHSIMIHRPDAKHVLVLGGGFNGVLKEILKYPVQDVEYVEIDPALLSFVEPVLNIQDQQALHDSRVHTVFMDGRDYLRRSTPMYDVIIMNVGEPSTASVNRFYSVEFFQQCQRALLRDGIVAFSFPSSDEYIADELKDLDASLYQTFKSIFSSTIIIPGTHAVLIGTTSELPFISQPDSLAHRFARAGISAEYVTPYTFAELMPADQIKSITNTLESVTHVRINTDNDPVTYYYDLLLWNKFLQDGNRLFPFLSRFYITMSGAVVSGFMMLFILLKRKQPEKQKRTALAVVMVVSGMTGMVLNLLFLLNFQEAFGSIYEMLGAVIAANMLGLALGVMGSSRLLKKYEPKSLLPPALAALVCLVLFLPTLLKVLLAVQFIPATLAATFLSGGLIGALFGIVNRWYLTGFSTTGSVYAYDLFGSSLGALTACSVLLPVLGIQGLASVLLLLIVPVLLALLLLPERSKNK